MTFWTLVSAQWGHAFLGGVFIGLGAAILWLFNGRVAGVSGILGGLIERASATDRLWRGAFVLGLLSAPLFYGLWFEQTVMTVTASVGQLFVAGLLVGWGSRYGSGCTSGHGICGIARLSARSILATLLFMTAGMVTVAVVRHVLAMN
jgi:uncharacterized membrane protein YedE/YeeE